MRSILFYLLVVCAGLFLPSSVLLGQSKENILVQTGAKSISTTDQFTIQFSITATEQLPTYRFPEINGFRKLGVSRSKASNFENEQVEQTLTFTQYYQANGPGHVLVPLLELEVNKQVYKIEPFVIQVVAGVEKQDEVPNEIQVPAIVDLESNKPFFLVRSDVARPFVGQSFTITMSLYVPSNNTMDLSFDRNDIQIPALIQQIRPHNCWEENFNLQVERVLKVTFRGKTYTEYRFFQASYFPLDVHAIQIPSVRLRVLQKAKSKEKTPLFLNSPAFVIHPKPMPKHVLSGKVPVGRIRW